MSSPAFLSVDAARAGDGFEPRAASPLARALAGAQGIRDLSLLGKLEVRNAPVADLGPDVDVLRITAARALVVCPAERCAELRASLSGFVVDLSGALAGIALQSPELMRRLTDLDLALLPAAGKLAGVQAFMTARDGEFRIFFAQEVGHYVVEVVRDQQAGLA